MKIRDLLLYASELLNNSAISSYQLDAELLLLHVLKKDRNYLYKNLDASIDESTSITYTLLIEKRCEKMPIAYIRGFKEFWSRWFMVNPSVLIPRPETEMIIERTLAIAKEKKQDSLRILDIGTGSGNIAITLAKELPNADVTAIDISQDALHVAQENSKLHQVSDKICFLKGNLFEPLLELCSFDLIVSNPPYVPTPDIEIPELQYEPRQALDGSSDGLLYIKKIIGAAPKFLKKDGILIIEIGYNQIVALQMYIENTQFSLHLFKDGNEVVRIIELRNKKYGKINH